MASIYWHKQTDKPLFPELEWNKPERRDQAGKIFILGGNLHNLGAPATAFEILKQTGAGNIKIALPDKTKRLVGKTLPEALFLPSTASGEFSLEGEVELLDHAVWADCLLLPGDSGRNSQTTILFSAILEAYKDQVVLTRDAVDIISSTPEILLSRPQTTIVVSVAQLQTLLKNFGEKTPITFTMDLVKLVDLLHEFTLNNPIAIVTLHQNQFIVAFGGKICTTRLSSTEEPKQWRLELSTVAACYQIWNPLKLFEALTHASFLTAPQSA